MPRLIKYLWENYIVWFYFCQIQQPQKYFGHEKSRTTVAKSDWCLFFNLHYWSAKVNFSMQKDCYPLACFLNDPGGARSNCCFNVKEEWSIHNSLLPINIHDLWALMFDIIPSIIPYPLCCLLLCRVFASFELAYILA